MTGRRWWGRVALVLASTLVALVAAELALRAMAVAPDRWSQPRHLESEDKRVALDLYPDNPRGAFPLDLRDEAERRRWREQLPEVDERYERTPYGVSFVRTEGLCRGEAIPARVEGTPRVLLIGDSFTEGQGVRQEETFAVVLEERLDAQLINCGRRGYDFPRLHEWFDSHLDLEPDVVVYAMVLNDPEQSPAFHARQQYIDDWIVDRRRMVSEGDGSPPPWQPRLFALVADRIEGRTVQAETTRWYREMFGEENARGWEATLDHVEAMRDAMRSRGGAFLVALWPLLVDLDSDYPFEDTHRAIAEGMRSRGVPFVDTLDAFRGEPASALWVHPADHHPNGAAHARFARAIEGPVRAALARAR